jgi:hypothetical protein
VRNGKPKTRARARVER